MSPKKKEAVTRRGTFENEYEYMTTMFEDELTSVMDDFPKYHHYVSVDMQLNHAASTISRDRYDFLDYCGTLGGVLAILMSTGQLVNYIITYDLF